MKPETIADNAEDETEHGGRGEIQEERIEWDMFHRENLLLLIFKVVLLY